MAREAEFTEALSILISKDDKERLKAIHEGERVSEAAVVRDVLFYGLPKREELHRRRLVEAGDQPVADKAGSKA